MNTYVSYDSDGQELPLHLRATDVAEAQRMADERYGEGTSIALLLPADLGYDSVAEEMDATTGSFFALFNSEGVLKLILQAASITAATAKAIAIYGEDACARVLNLADKDGATADEAQCV